MGVDSGFPQFKIWTTTNGHSNCPGFDKDHFSESINHYDSLGSAPNTRMSSRVPCGPKEAGMRVDSHQHYWKVGRGDYHWMSPSMPALYRDFLPNDLLPMLREQRIDKTIVVQAAHTLAETEFLLALAANEDSIAGVVGWLELDSVSFPEQFDTYRKRSKFAGIRPMLQDIAEDDWILRPRVLESLQVIAESHFPIDLLVYSRHLPHILKMLEVVPTLRAVVDHLAKPDIHAGIMDPWKSLLRELAQHQNLHCKLSGMITEANIKNWKANDFRPYVDHALECFGVDRLMYGSDWPVCLLAGSYAQTVNLVQELLGVSESDPGSIKIFGTTAIRFYGLQ
jgi:L-fuconolactonase